jgi:ADP-ribose pyrophosphatase YjhB (NUDIX family)
MEPGIENFAGVIIENEKGEILLVRKVDQYAYAIPWCRVTPGKSLQQCLVDRVMDLTGLSIQPVFLGPSEHIEEDNHFISFDHTAKIDTASHHYIREGLDFFWAGAEELLTVPLVALTRQILEKHFLDHGIEPELSSEPKDFTS